MAKQRPYWTQYQQWSTAAEDRLIEIIIQLNLWREKDFIFCMWKAKNKLQNSMNKHSNKPVWSARIFDVCKDSQETSSVLFNAHDFLTNFNNKRNVWHQCTSQEERFIKIEAWFIQKRLPGFSNPIPFSLPKWTHWIN